MLNLNLLKTDQWKHRRLHQEDKWKNAHWLEKFNKSLDKISGDFDGSISYYDGPFLNYPNNKINSNTDKRLEYCENTPVFYHFKLVPNGYFLYDYNPMYLYRDHFIDDDILSCTYSFDVNKYEQPLLNIDINYPFILFPLQSLNDRNCVIKIVEIIKWAEKNETHIVFKKHPFNDKNSHVDSLFYRLQESNKITKYTTVVESDVNTDYLLEQCFAVWTFSSGVGFQSLLKEKPVSIFSKDHYYVDYAPVAKICNTPDEAFDNTFDLTDTKRFLSWYYHTFILDISNKDFEEKLYNRLKMYFKDGKNVDELFGPVATSNHR